MATITFLKASDGRRLSKKYGTKNGTEAYPNVAFFDSYATKITHDHQGLVDFETALQSAAKNGECMLKGNALTQLKKERRGGITERTEKTDHIVIDIDGLDLDGQDLSKMKFDKLSISKMADKVIERFLPKELEDVSYILGVSSSFGIKPTVNLHYHFLLKEAVDPKILKEWLKLLNLDHEEISEQLTLNKTKKAVKWIIDPATANNAQLIYIASPVFTGKAVNPLNDNDRIFLVNKVHHTLDLKPLLKEVDPEVVYQKQQDVIKKRYKELGIRYVKPKYYTAKDLDSGAQFQCVSNPPKMRIEYSYHKEEYAYFNVNGGDSNAYWCYIKDPKIMRNFKGDEPFNFEAADPETYRQFCETFNKQITHSQRAMVIHDLERDLYAKVRYEPREQKVTEFNYSKKDSLDDWLVSHGECIPDAIAPWTIDYNPHNSINIDMQNSYINLFVETDYMKQTTGLPKSITEGLEYGFAARLQFVCPRIFTIVSHMLGGEPVTFEHFINWLAFIFQKREKTGTAWLLQGTQGTGKGLFFKRIIEPLFNHPKFSRTKPAAMEKKMDDFTDKFNGYFEHALFMMIDEFRMKNSNDKGIENFFKNAITEEWTTIRLMRSNPIQRQTFTNFIFTSNDFDAVNIPHDDRRWNIAEPQRVKLDVVMPDVYDEDIVNPEIESELTMFAAFLNNFQVNSVKAKKPMMNKAKSKVREAAADSYQLLLMKFIEGDLEVFIEIIEAAPSTDLEMLRHSHVRATVMKWILEAVTNQTTYVTKHDLRHVCEYFANRDIARRVWNAMLAKAGLEEERVQVDGSRGRYLVTNFKIEEELATDMLERNLTEIEIATFKSDYPLDTILKKVTADE